MATSFVIDASITLAWLFDENGRGESIQAQLKDAELMTPWLWRLEIVNALLKAERTKRMTQAVSVQLMEILSALDVEIIPEPQTRTLQSLAQTARPHQLTSYDAVYFDLAVTMGVGLFTDDQNLKDACNRTGVPLIMAE